ncbi:MAG TPA: MoaD/ThiS family protein [Thermoplasmata archaeon]
MRVRVRLFATYREIAGEGALPWTLPEGARLRDLVDALVGTYPRLAGHTEAMLLAVNLSYASPDVVLHDGDEVAVMPPVSGGGT